MTTADTTQLVKANFVAGIIEEILFAGETTLIVRKDALKSILTFLKQDPQGYEVLMDLTAVDYLFPTKRTKIIYWLHNPSDYQRIRIAIYVEREESVPTVTDLWEGANWYEREVYDLFGVSFDNHLTLTRILMPDDWQGHPLRRDYALTEEPVEFKHGVKPKVPSEIIPYVRNNHSKT